jgi:hypothetical protein
MIAKEEALSRVRGLEPAAALAEVERLAEAGEADALEALAEGAGDKAVRKAAGRALHRLATRGVKASHAPRLARQTAAEGAPAPLPGYVSAVDAIGDRLVWLPRAEPGSATDVTLFVAVLRDAEEILRCESGGDLSRSGLKREIAAMAKREIPLAEVPAAWARWLIEEAAAGHRRRGGTPPHPYGSARPGLGDPPPAPERHPAYEAAEGLEAPPEPERRALARQADRLWEDALFAGWTPPQELLYQVAAAIVEVDGSQLLVDEGQRQRARLDVLERWGEKHFGAPGRRAIWARRLRDNAHLAALAGRRETARVALAAADELDDAARPIGESVFARTWLGRWFPAAQAVDGAGAGPHVPVGAGAGAGVGAGLVIPGAAAPAAVAAAAAAAGEGVGGAGGTVVGGERRSPGGIILP